MAEQKASRKLPLTAEQYEQLAQQAERVAQATALLATEQRVQGAMASMVLRGNGLKEGNVLGIESAQGVAVLLVATE